MEIIQKIKSFLAARQIKRVVAQARLTHFPDFEQVKNILILFQSDENEENKLIRNMVASLKEMGKKTVAWGYVDKKEIKTPIMPDFRLFANKDISFFGVPSLELKNEFLVGKYDITILLTTSDIVPLDYFFALSKSPFKASKTKTVKGISDFMIELDPKQDEQFLFDQILFYLQSIQAKN